MADYPIPILQDTKDPHYRYKMPKLTAKVEGSGNGIKTVITNMQAIARALGRPPAYPTKYFGCELGAQVTMNQDLFVVNGSHDPEKLLNLLYVFIRKFVLCQKCKNPETSLIVSNQIKQKCIACGHEHVIPKTLHKLTTYIINHPPDGSNPTLNGVSSSVSEKPSKSKKSKKNGKDGASANTSPNGTNSYDNNNNKDDDFGDDDFDDDELTTEAYLERQRELCDGLPSGKYDAAEHANIFFKLLKEKKDADQLDDANVQKELVKEAERLEIKDKSTLVLTELLLTKDNILADIKKNRTLFLRFCHQNPKAQKYLLGGYEKLVGELYKDDLFVNSMKILKQFYDEDILEEEVLIEWSKKPSKKYVSKEMSKKIHEKVEPFIKWLKEAEVDSSDENDESDEAAHSANSNETKDEDEDVDASPPPLPPPVTKQTNKQVKNSERKQSLEDDDEEDEDFLEFSHRVSGIQLVDDNNKSSKTAVSSSSSTAKPNAAAASQVTNGSEADYLADDDIDNI
jgi:translation initiation factor 5